MLQIDDLLTKLPLTIATHETNIGALSLMECVAFIAGEPHTAYPACACPVTTVVATYANDYYLATHRDALAQRVLALAGSRSSEEVTLARLCLLADYAVHTVLPAELEGRDANLSVGLRVFPEIIPANCAKELALASLLFVRPDSLLIDDTVKRYLQNAAYRVAHEQYGDAAQDFAYLFGELDAEFDVLQLLDRMLAIGNTTPLPVMLQVLNRIYTLTERHWMVTTRRRT